MVHPAAVLALFLLPPFLLVLTQSAINRGKTKSQKRLPSPSKLPFIGNLHQLGPLIWRSLQHLSAKHGPLMLLQMGGVQTLIVSSHETAQQILKTHNLIFATRPNLKAPRILLHSSDGVIFAPYGDHWRQMRKLAATHLFSSRMIQSLRPTREAEVALMLARIASEKGAALRLTDILNQFAADLLCSAVLGASRKGHRVRGLMRESSVLLGKLYAEDFFPGLWWLDALLGLDGRLKKCSSQWDALLDQVLEEEEEEEEEGEDTSFAKVLLSLHRDGRAEKRQIKSLLLDIMVAGAETTVGVLDWGMAELIRNPEIMKKVQMELIENSNIVDGQLLQEEDLKKMNYLKAVIKETLRLHPPTPLLLPYESLQECEINGYIIPKQTRVTINAWAIGRDSLTWEAAEKFIPERWIGSNIDYKGHDFHFIPFGSGRRICLGMQLATSTIEIAMANLLYCFEWKLPDGMERCDMDMVEASKLSAPRNQKLDTIAIPRSTYLSVIE